jgi:flavin-dependent dehydrogenase
LAFADAAGVGAEMKREIGNAKRETELWDAVVVGAGVAGGVAAAVLAGRGWRVLLVERSAWPREKACGGCLNAAGVEMLRGAGLTDVLRGAGEMRRMELHAGGRVAAFSLPAGAVVERQMLDARLAAVAVARGAVFMVGAMARLLPEDDSDWRAVQISSGDEMQTVRGRVILACDGLGKSGSGFLGGERWTAVRVEADGRLGFSATVDAEGWKVESGTLVMSVGAEGYVGMVRLPGEHRRDADATESDAARIHIGAALLPGACHARRGPAGVIERILNECGLEGAGCAPAPPAAFVGTGILTRRRAVVGRGRVLAIGDACGYVEPFTGEGMAWAIRGALAAAEVLPMRAAAIGADVGEQWRRRFENDIRPRQKWCRGLRHVLGNQRLAVLGVSAAQFAPWGARRLAQQVSAG